MMNINELKVGSIAEASDEYGVFILAKEKDKSESFLTRLHMKTYIAYVDKDYLLSHNSSGHWLYIILNKGRYD